MQFDVNINTTIEIPEDEFDYLKEWVLEINDAEEWDDDFQADLDYELESYIETNLDLYFLTGDAWLCAVTDFSEL